VTSGWHPETVQIAAGLRITDILPVSEEPIVRALQPFHIWNEQFISDRLKWKPRQPLYTSAADLQASQAQIIPYRSEYGLQSWIDLAEPISIENAVPVLNDAAYTQLVAEIHGLSKNCYASSVMA